MSKKHDFIFYFQPQQHTKNFAEQIFKTEPILIAFADFN